MRRNQRNSNRILRKVFFLLSFLPFSAASQVGLDSLFSCYDLEDDLDSLLQTIVESHPNPYAFCGEQQFNTAFENARSQLDTSLTLREYTRIVAQFMSVMEDSHSSLDYGQLQELQFHDDGFFMPFSVYRTDDNFGGNYCLLVERDWENVLPRGGQLFAINGIGSDSIYNRALEYSCIEGSAQSARNSVAAAIFPVIAGIMHPSDSINIVSVIPPGSDTPVDFNLRGYKHRTYKRLRKERSRLPENKFIHAEYDDSLSLATLKVGTFAPPAAGYYKRYIKKVFREIRKNDYRHLVLDLRGNGGGSSAWVEYLYSFLDDEGYNTPNNVIGKNSEIAMKRARLMNTGFAQLVIRVFFRNDEDVMSFRHLSELPWGEMDTIYFHEKTKQKRSLVFDGKCYLLINGLTASAGVDFTNAFRHNGRGIIIGEPCLGPNTGTWGNPARYTLPKTRLKVSIATIRYNYDDSFFYERNAIQPDYIIRPNAEDLSKQKDTQMEFTRELVMKK